MLLEEAIREVEAFLNDTSETSSCTEEAVKVVLAAAIRLYFLENPNAKSTV